MHRSLPFLRPQIHYRSKRMKMNIVILSAATRSLLPRLAPYQVPKAEPKPGRTHLSKNETTIQAPIEHPIPRM